MASKKAGRLAGLAALAGLAYMANKKGEGKTPDAGKSETKETPAPARDDSKKVIESRVRKDDDITVAGEGGFDAPADMSRVSRVGTPARTASSVKAPVIGGPTPARAPGGAGKRGAVSAGPTPARAPGGVGKRGGVSNEEKANMMDLPPYRENPDSYDMSMKRGGKVKKMASGGMASKRGDGIASKGKTRCKMY
jgi:hypothetical protein